MNKFENLEAWQKAKDLALHVYAVTDSYPKQEVFALTSQTTRAVVSISANIAEGTSRSSVRDFSHFLEISIGSLFELKTLLEIAFGRGYFTETVKKSFDQELDTSVKLIYGLKRSLYHE